MICSHEMASILDKDGKEVSRICQACGATSVGIDAVPNAMVFNIMNEGVVKSFSGVAMPQETGRNPLSGEYQPKR